jgi:acyl carrier protein
MASSGDNAARLRDLVAETLRIKPDDVTDEVDMEDTGTWDSLSHMELIAAIEDEFGVSLTADEIVSMRSVGSIKDVLRRKSVEL